MDCRPNHSAAVLVKTERNSGTLQLANIIS